MIEAYPTKHGTGVEFIGTYNDFASLYDTMTKLAMTNIEMLSEDERLLTVIPYDLRHAFQGDREVYEKTQMFGFKTNWVTLLYTIACLRHHQNYVPLDKVDLANLLIFESLTENAMLQYDPQGYAELRWFVGMRINIGDKYAYLAYREAANDFFSMPNGKKRFRSIPRILIKWGIGSPEYNNFCKEIDKYIEDNNCHISHIDRDISGDENIVW
ncbi:hypothetical protein KML24007_04190 [Alistipes indistinctus]|uniref:DUF6904 family protein n=1 Tax=Alistipes indistinctus TaxID=626932 RepID=UPI0036F2269A